MVMVNDDKEREAEKKKATRERVGGTQTIETIT